MVKPSHIYIYIYLHILTYNIMFYKFVYSYYVWLSLFSWLLLLTITCIYIYICIYIYTCMYRLPTFLGTCSKVGPCPATFSTFSEGGWWWMGVRETLTLVGNWGCVGVPMTRERKPQILGRWWERNLEKKVGQTLNHLLFLLLVNHLFKEHIYIYIFGC